MDEPTRRPMTCYRDGCNTVEDFPVLTRIIETGSGPGGMLYACADHAREDYRSHHRHCADCRSGERCQTAADMRSDMLKARRARAALAARP